GYNRHFTILKEKEIAFPIDEEEQKAIAGVLRKTESALTHQSGLLVNLQETKHAAMRELFTHGLRGEAQKNTEIGLIPLSWSIGECDDLCEEITVGVVVKPASYYVDEGVPAFR